MGCSAMIVGAISANFVNGNQVFILPVLFGFGMAIMEVQSFAFIAELIGENVTTSAFVYSALSLIFKLLSGPIVLLIQAMSPCKHDAQSELCVDNACSLFYHHLIGKSY